MGELFGKLALITGAGTGIGRAVARGLAKNGCRVIVCGRRLNRLQSVAASLPDKSILPFVLDVKDSAAVDALPQSLPKEWKQIDILINNAGHEVGGRRRFGEGTADEWAAILETNVLGLFRVTRAILPDIVARGDGHVINIGSVSGLRPGATRTAYSASKHAVHGFSESLRMDYAGTGLRVTEILPGIVKTDFSLARWGNVARAKKFYDSHPEALEPDDIAESILYALRQPKRVNVSQVVLTQSSMP